VLFEQSSALGPYFDGSTADPSISVNSLAWNGTANASTSTLVWESDPGSPYFGQLVPRKQVVIEENGQRVYTGTVEDWNLDYALSGDSTATVSCADGLSSIAQAVAPVGTATAQLSGARINAYLTEAGWPAAQRSISTGQATLAADPIAENTNAIAYLQKAADSDPGVLFVGKSGLMTFRDRADLQAFTSNVTFGTGGIPFTDIRVEYGSEELYPVIEVEYWGGTAVASLTVSNAASVAAYGENTLAVSTLLASATDATTLGTFLSNRYGSPQYRVTGLTVGLHGLGSSDVSKILGLELGDMVQVVWTPNGVGSAISQFVTVEGIDHSANPSTHFVTLTLSETFASFQLDSAVFGVLDDDTLGF
jgi:hypothetical protein